MTIEKLVKALRIGFVGYTTREVPTGTGGVKNEYDPIRVNVYSVHEKKDFIDYNLKITIFYLEIMLNSKRPKRDIYFNNIEILKEMVN